jgi:ubiquinone/menaquinone biosynthesis C-methylase UbiE
VGGYVLRGGQEGYDRIQVLARSRWPDTEQLLDRIDVRVGMDCVDVGCGGGAVTLALARRVGPTGRAVGLDLDETQLRLAAAVAAEADLANVAFRVADLSTAVDLDGSDVVYSRLLLQHLRDPVALLARLWAAVRPGGVLAVEDADFDGCFCDPPNSAFTFFVQSYQHVAARRGGDSTYGRKLAAAFTAAAVPRPELELRAVLYRGEGRLLPWLTVAHAADAIVAEGVASPDEIQTALIELRRLADDDTVVMGGPRIFQAWTRRA